MTATQDRLSERLIQVVGENPEFQFHFLSRLLRRPVRTTVGRLGRLKDLVARVAAPYPQVVGAVIDRGWGKPLHSLPWDRIRLIDPHAIEVTVNDDDPPFQPYTDQPGCVLLGEHLLGQTILDIDGRRTKVVNDIHLLESKGRILLVHVDISFRARLRRSGLEWLGWGKESLVSWRVFRPLTVEDAARAMVMLTMTRKEAAYAPAEDLAFALDQLKGATAASAQPGSPADAWVASVDFVAVHPYATAADVLAALREAPHRPDALSTPCVVDGEGHLVGVLDLAALIGAEPRARADALMTSVPASARPGDSRVQILGRFRGTTIRLIPIVDEAGRLVGAAHRSDFLG